MLKSAQHRRQKALFKENQGVQTHLKEDHMRYFTLILTMIIALQASPAKAAEINDAGQKQLQTIFSELISRRQANLENHNRILKTDGKIMVEQASDYYAVTLPAMTLTNEQNVTAKIGLTAINVTPTEKSDEWKMSVAIPTPILYTDKNGKDVMRIDIGNQEMGGIWNSNIKKFTKLAANYGDIKITHFQRQEILTLGKVDIASDLKEDKPQHWSGPTRILASNLNITKPDERKVLSAEEIGLSFDMTNFPLLEFAKAIDKTDLQTTAFQELFSKMGEKLLLQANFKNIDVNTPSFLNLPFQGVTLDLAETSLSFSGLTQDKVNQSLKLQYSGLKHKNAEKEKISLLPNRFSTFINIDKLPLKEISSTLASIIPTSKKQAPAQQVAAMQAMVLLPRILSTAGTNIDFEGKSERDSIYSTDLKGALQANATSILGATGDAVFSIEGLDKAIAVAEQSPKKKSVFGRLLAMKKICTPEGDKNVCHFKLTDQAKMTINGQDIQTLPGAMNGTASGNKTTEDKPAGR